MIDRRSVLAVGAAALCAPAAFAHTLDLALVEIAWRADTGRLEVVHQYYLHDLEAAAIERLGERPADGWDDLRLQAAAALYIVERFAVRTGDGRAIDLEFVGAEPEGRHLFVYQEAVLTTPPEAVEVRAQAMLDRSRDHVTYINADLGSGVRSGAARTGSTWVTLTGAS